MSFKNQILSSDSNSPLQLTHAESVRVGHTGPDLHLAVRAPGARLAGFGADTLLGKRPRDTDLAQGVSLEATLPGGALATGAFGAGRTQAMASQEEEAVVTFALCVLISRARGDRGDTGWALVATKARAEAFRWGKRSWETDDKISVPLTIISGNGET